MPVLSRLYAIVDTEALARRNIDLAAFARELAEAGVGLGQLRAKSSSPQEVLANAALLREAFAGTGATLVMNDRADLAALAEFDGVHVGQGDLPPESARRVMGAGKLVGVSTHSTEQVRRADAGCADYAAIGPVFSTATKRDAAPVVGLEGVRQARRITAKPLVAIGGITLENAASVMEAGADCIAVISGLLVDGEAPGKVARDFLRLLR